MSARNVLEDGMRGGDPNKPFLCHHHPQVCSFTDASLVFLFALFNWKVLGMAEREMTWYKRRHNTVVRDH